ncbi:hypothetical protein NW762_010598 [Fusarium torreyae]|uniref:Apple domain-containing protein n=1 Tax=Fusarium torreyae TaxID=1237075 RepID=A0A9W8RT95_9HYPO|nr:hypothetical protein NW762_010598 [Fusarium torreyae]
MSRPLVLLAIAGLAIAGPCRPGSSSSLISEVSGSYSATISAATTSTTESLPDVDPTTLTGDETTTLSIASDTTIVSIETTTAETTTGTSTGFLPETTTTAVITTETTLATISSSEEPAATTSAATVEPYECLGSLKIQHDYYIGIRGGYQGSQTLSACAQLCEDSPSCYAFSHNSAQNCWIGTKDDVAVEGDGEGWTSGKKTSGSKASCPK